MDEKMREEMVQAIIQATRVMGTDDYREGMKKAKALLEFALRGADSMQTIEGLRASLDSLTPISQENERLLLFGLQNLPQLLRLGLTSLAKTSATTLPQFQPGRGRALTQDQASAVADYISELHRKGTMLGIAKRRAADKYRVSLRTCERIWVTRSAIPDKQPTIQDVIDLFASLSISEQNLGVTPGLQRHYIVRASGI